MNIIKTSKLNLICFITTLIGCNSSIISMEQKELSFDDMPNEIKYKILDYCLSNEMLEIIQYNKQLNSIESSVLEAMKRIFNCIIDSREVIHYKKELNILKIIRQIFNRLTVLRKTNRSFNTLLADYKRLSLASDLRNSFLSLNIDINEKNKYGWTTLMRIARKRYKYMITLLIDAGADINAQDDDGYTALINAAMLGDVDIAELLINSGARINTKNNSGNTALIWAARYGYIDVVKLLINAGADINIQNNKGKTVLMWANQYNYVDIIQILTQQAQSLK